MINFFRKIRKQLADDNKPLKYMRYAIGEIVLVVIGILIALQVNNWNQSNNEKILEKEYLSRLLQDLDFDIKSFRTTIRLDSSKVENARLLLQKFKQAEIWTEDDLANVYREFVINANLNVQRVTIDEIKSSGRITLIRNKDLRLHMMTYYANLEKTLSVSSKNNDHAQVWNRILLKEIDMNSMLQAFDLNIPEVDSMDLTYFNTTSKNPLKEGIQNFASLKVLTSSYNLRQYRNRLNEAQELKRHIIDYLNN